MTSSRERFGVFPDLHITVETLSDRPVRVRVAGEVTVANAERLADILHRIVDVDRAPSVEVDLGLVTFLDSTGIGKLIKAQAHANRAGSELWVVQPSPFARRVLSLVGVLDTLTAPGRVPPHRFG